MRELLSSFAFNFNLRRYIKYAIDRFAMETKRQFDVLDKQLEARP